MPLEKPKIVDQQRLENLGRFLDEHRSAIARQGSIAAGFRKRNGRLVGPYFKLTFRNEHRQQVSIYLGSESPLVAFAREQLEVLQHRRKEDLAVSKLVQRLRSEKRALRRELSKLLAPRGLELKGSELRGWRKRITSNPSAEPLTEP